MLTVSGRKLGFGGMKTILLAVLAGLVCASCQKGEPAADDGKTVVLIEKHQVEVRPKSVRGAGGLSWPSGPVTKIKVSLRHQDGPPLDVAVVDKASSDKVSDGAEFDSVKPVWVKKGFRDAVLDTDWVDVNLPDSIVVIVQNLGDKPATVTVEVVGKQKRK
jgi:hypothetical protein